MILSFDCTIAERYGLKEAIILNGISFWVEYNEANGINFHDGRYWVYNTIETWLKIYPFMGIRTLKEALKHLKEEGLIITGNYNDNPMNHTMWYSLPDNAPMGSNRLCKNCTINGANSAQSTKNCTIDGANSAQSTYNNKYNTVNTIKKEILSKDNIPKERELSFTPDAPTEDKNISSAPAAEEALTPNPLPRRKSPDWGAIKMAWNETVKSLPQLSQITERRKKAITLRAREQGWTPEDIPDRLRELFKKIQASDFLTGRSGKWTANFDWIFLPTNFIKVLEGNYDNNAKQHTKPNLWSGAPGVAERYQPNPEAVRREQEEERREQEEYDNSEDREYSIWEL